MGFDPPTPTLPTFTSRVFLRTEVNLEEQYWVMADQSENLLLLQVEAV